VRVFLDTNVLASSIATRGLCAELFESIINEHELLTCDPVLRELARVLSDKFHLPDSLINAFIRLLKAEGLVIKAQERPTIKFKHADDIPILACVVASEADVFVTGDKALLELGTIENIRILSPRELWQKLSGLEDASEPK
jgi:putative PIN family toxin of toxin-antitoxin system